MAKSKDIEAVPWEAVHWEANNLMGGLSILRERAELQALDAIGWYYSKKKSKNFWSRWLRFWAILYTILGGLAPILSATGLAQLIAQYFYGNVDDRDLRLAEMRFNQCGYVLIGLAAGCLAFDRFFGFSTNWMRYIGAAMRIETARVRFRFEWERLAAPLKGSEPDKDGLEDFLEAIERFASPSGKQSSRRQALGFRSFKPTSRNWTGRRRRFSRALTTRRKRWNKRRGRVRGIRIEVRYRNSAGT